MWRVGGACCDPAALSLVAASVRAAVLLMALFRRGRPNQRCRFLGVKRTHSDAIDPIRKSALSASLPGGGQNRLQCTLESALLRLRRSIGRQGMMSWRIYFDVG
jgi:hypothetical protein